jgi:serine carboxypeptidase 1
MEIGPLDIGLNPRNHTWLKYANILFIDNPVGTGFSYVENDDLFCNNNQDIARDLVELTRGFLNEFPEFQKIPLHIFSESYGGKMAVEFCWELHQEIERGIINCNLKSVGLGSPYISPIGTDSILIGILG